MNMSSSNYYQALSHLVLAGTGVYCITNVGGVQYGFDNGCFGVIIVNNILHLWKTGNPSYGDKISDVCRLTREIQDLFILPLITTTIWLNYSYRWEYAYSHSIAALFPLCSYLFDKRSYELEHLMTTVNLASLGVISFMHENYWGLAAMVTYALDYFLKQDQSQYDIPYYETSNYLLSFFAYFSLRAVLD